MSLLECPPLAGVETCPAALPALEVLDCLHPCEALAGMVGPYLRRCRNAVPPREAALMLRLQGVVLCADCRPAVPSCDLPEGDDA
jgi:hypothetical protein